MRPFIRCRSFLLVMSLLLLPGVAHSEEGNKVALVMKALSNPFFAKMEAGAKEYAKANSIPLEVFGVERETDVDHQIGIVDNLISSGAYKAIVIAPADSVRLIPVCKKAIDKGIVIINIDNPLHRETLAASGIFIPFVGSDNSQGAGMVGDYIKTKLGGKGKVIVIEGIQGVENADLRKSGFIHAVTLDSQIEVVSSESANWHTDEALALVVQLWKKHGPVDAIFCANDNMALGALQALDMLDTAGKVWLGAYDNIEAVRNEMGNGRIHATVEQHPELMGQFGVELAVQSMAGKRAPQHTPTPLDLITYETFKKKIALSISELKNPFFSSLHRGVQKAADLFGMQLIVANAQNDEAQQLADLQNLIDQKADLIIVNPTNAETITAGIELINKAEIPVITIDRKAAEGKIACHIASDNIAGGKMAGDLLARMLNGSGRVLEIEGIPGASAAYERGVGFNEVLKNYPDIKVVGREVAFFDHAKAESAIKGFLEKGVAFDAVFAHNDSMILGAMDALQPAKLEKAPILIGFDGIPEALLAIRKGELTATIAQKPEAMGMASVQSAARLLRGQELTSPLLVELEVIEKKP